MEELIKRAIKVMEENPALNEIELRDGCLSVRVVRNAPNIWYFQPAPLTTTFQWPPTK